MHFIFFFQAEDGIRDYKVTGVQTCALPILSAASLQVSRSSTTPFSILVLASSRSTSSVPRPAMIRMILILMSGWNGSTKVTRSEERRVGKECRGGGGTKCCEGKERNRRKW